MVIGAGMHGYWQSAILAGPLALNSTWDGTSKSLTAICIPNHFGNPVDPAHWKPQPSVKTSLHLSSMKMQVLTSVNDMEAELSGMGRS